MKRSAVERSKKFYGHFSVQTWLDIDTSEEICSSKINVSKERKSAQYCNSCYALEVPGCHRLLTFILG